MIRQQRQQIERIEAQQEAELRLSSKRIRAEQERELKEFRESQKQELRLLKQEIDLMPKEKRKSIFKERKEKLEKDHEEKVCVIFVIEECPLEMVLIGGFYFVGEIIFRKIKRKSRKFVEKAERFS